MMHFFKNLFETKTTTIRKSSQAAFKPGLEALEDRRLMAINLLADGTLSITGTDNSETIGIYAFNWIGGAPGVVINIKNSSGTVVESGMGPRSAINSIKVEAKAGSDLVINSTDITSKLYGGVGDDTLQGGSSSDELWGEGDNDSLEGRGAATDMLVGGTGNDTFVFGNSTGWDVVFEYAGEGSDWLDFAARTSSQVILNLNDQTHLIGNDTIGLGGEPSAMENVRGTKYADLLIGNAAANRLEGMGDGDQLFGAGGNDVLVGGAGNDSYMFDASATGHDTITEAASGGTDWLDFSNIGTRTVLDLAKSDKQLVNNLKHLSLTLTNPEELENAKGSSAEDSLTGNSRDNELLGLGGDDNLIGASGNDTLTGGSNDDTYWFVGSNLGHDRIVDESGVNSLNFSMFTPPASSFIEHTARHDGLDFTLGKFAVTLDMGTTSRQTVATGHLDLTLSSGTAVDNVYGSNGKNHVIGNSLENLIMGGAEGDWLEGAAGSDWLYGGAGADILIGCDGADHIFGDGGEDDLWGGFFDDVFADDSTEDQLDGGTEWDTYHDNSPTWWN